MTTWTLTTSGYVISKRRISGMIAPSLEIKSNLLVYACDRSTTAHTSLSQTRAFLHSMIRSPYNGVLNFTVCLLETSNPSEPSFLSERQIVIGKAGIWNGEEIGFIFDKDYWRKRYAFEALSAIMKQYWVTRQPEKVVKPVKADVDPRNKACLRLLDKLGFQVVGYGEKTYKTHLGWCDSVYLEARMDRSRFD
jgi:ribosomal-protein-alanine N-acetyltransferase